MIIVIEEATSWESARAKKGINVVRYNMRGTAGPRLESQD